MNGGMWAPGTPALDPDGLLCMVLDTEPDGTVSVITDHGDGPDRYAYGQADLSQAGATVLMAVDHGVMVGILQTFARWMTELNGQEA